MFQKNCFISFNENSLKMMTNGYFTLKALFFSRYLNFSISKCLFFVTIIFIFIQFLGLILFICKKIFFLHSLSVYTQVSLEYLRHLVLVICYICLYVRYSYKKNQKDKINVKIFGVTAWFLPLPLHILGNMSFANVCSPGCPVINFEINLIVLIEPFST